MTTIANAAIEVMREAGGQCRSLEVIQAIFDALDVIDAKGNWEFLLTKSNINVRPPYQVGGISIAAGATAATGVGTLWNSSNLTIPELVISGHRPYACTITNDTNIVLLDPFLGPTVTNTPYKLYQADYLLPADCEGGRDLVLRGPRSCGPLGNGEIPKKNRAYFERRMDMTLSPGRPVTYYTDADNRGDNTQARIRLFPYPTVAAELEVTYYRTLKFNRLTVNPQTEIPLPPVFQGVVVMLAAGIVMRRRKMQGWLLCYQDGLSSLGELYARYAASPAYEDLIEFNEDHDYGMRGYEGFAITTWE